mmetsp:Transcript_95845/g.219680  ORF Transcript_95845/g.219680 Transcript_95845/m.219680 type:complete len:179 (+) Transcript_95845:72-608(+)
MDWEESPSPACGSPRDAVGSQHSIASSSAQWAMPGQSVVILDFDNVLLPSLWLIQQAPKIMRVQKPVPFVDLGVGNCQLRCFMEQVEIMLDNVEHVGDLAIVTDSEPGWVSYCVAAFMPELTERFERIPVVHCGGAFSSSGRDIHDSCREQGNDAAADTLRLARKAAVFGFRSLELLL